MTKSPKDVAAESESLDAAAPDTNSAGSANAEVDGAEATATASSPAKSSSRSAALKTAAQAESSETNETEPAVEQDAEPAVEQDAEPAPEQAAESAAPQPESENHDSPKDILVRYLQDQRDALLWKLEGLSERDARWPQTPTGTNLLGLVKHVANIEAGYFGATFGRPFSAPGIVPEEIVESEPNADLWATADESIELISDLYKSVWAHADKTITENDLEGIGNVPWWGDDGEVTLHQILVHVITELARHTGQADIIRETLDGAAGLRDGVSNLPDQDAEQWAAYRTMLEEVAHQVGGPDPAKRGLHAG